ncbi:MAG: hypothetical protein IAF38_01195, partial [Bacteroidia bacterium]|nr:hypothetical protein [Bacteroidia bacterium]
MDLDFNGHYSNYASSVHEGVSVMINLELKQEGNKVEGKIFSEGNTYYNDEPADGFSYKLVGYID